MNSILKVLKNFLSFGVPLLIEVLFRKKILSSIRKGHLKIGKSDDGRLVLVYSSKKDVVPTQIYIPDVDQMSKISTE